MENVYSALEDVIQTIISSSEYQTCLSLKEQMKNNEEVMQLIEKVKETQKKYIRSGYDSSIKKELDEYNQQLIDIPIYHTYQESLEKVNEMIGYVKDTLNDYFTKLLNS